MKVRKAIILTLLVLACTLFQRTYAQPLNPLISFSVESCTLDEALEKLFAEYELNVAFSKAELSKIRIEGYSCTYKSVEEVLSDLLKGTDYGFKKVGKQYVIRKEQQTVVEIPENAEPPEELVTQKTDIVVDKTPDTVWVVDTVKYIRTVMRYDTIVQVETHYDTVYAVKLKGIAFPWPSFKDNGWFVTPSLTISSLNMEYHLLEPATPTQIAPLSANAFGLDFGYKHKRLNVGLSLAYKSVSYAVSFERVIEDGGYYVNDTLDTYYVVYPSGDTTYQYVLDSTYIPLTTTNLAYDDVNRIDYLGIGLFTSVDFVKSAYFRMFAKAGVSAYFPLVCSGAYFIADEPCRQEITKAHAEPVRLAWMGGLGMGLKLGNHFEFVPEVSYRQMVGSPYRVGFPVEMRLRYWDFRLGLTYYF